MGGGTFIKHLSELICEEFDLDKTYWTILVKYLGARRKL